MASSVQILGIRFFNGDVDEAIALMFQRGGFLIAPSGTCFTRLRNDERYRRAVVVADLAIADSGLMVLLRRMLQREKVERISGLKYLKHLLHKLKDEGTGKICWVLSSERAKQKLFDWSRREDFPLAIKNCYVAPWYGLDIEDQNLLGLVERHRPVACDYCHWQRRTGETWLLFAREFVVSAGDPLHRRRTRFCHGRADSDSRLGGLVVFRMASATVDSAGRFVPRLIRGLELPWLIWKYREDLPPMRAGSD